MGVDLPWRILKSKGTVSKVSNQLRRPVIVSKDENPSNHHKLYPKLLRWTQSTRGGSHTATIVAVLVWLGMNRLTLILLYEVFAFKKTLHEICGNLFCVVH